MARHLAHLYGASEEKACLAGWIHDCAKEMTLSEMQELEAMWTYEKSNEKILKRLLELLGNHLKRLDDRIEDLDILRHEIKEYQERIRAKIGK